MLQLRLPFASPSPKRNPSSSPTPKGGKPTMNGGEDPGGMGELPNTPSNLQEALQAPKRVSLSWKMRNAQNLARSKIKYPFFDMSATPPLNLVLAPLRVRFYELNCAQPCGRSVSLFTAQPCRRSTSLFHRSTLCSLTTLCIWSTRRDFNGAWPRYLLQIDFFLVQNMLIWVLAHFPPSQMLSIKKH